MKKTARIKDRRQAVLDTISSWTMRDWPTTFDKIVSQTKFSRAEVAHHLSVLKRKGKITEGDNGFVKQQTNSERMDDFNEAMYGSSSIIHIFGVGYVNPHSRYSSRYLDP